MEGPRVFWGFLTHQNLRFRGVFRNSAGEMIDLRPQEWSAVVRDFSAFFEQFRGFFSAVVRDFLVHLKKAAMKKLDI